MAQDVKKDDPVAAAARVLAEHFPQRNSRGPMLCYCGKEWHPRHQAEALARAGLIREVTR